ncbi:MAG: hypothetical protein IPK52_11040, partial [Chloroflexi bacterium]|nr:hypothetical protein [Chloroflexota bacterium]
MPDQPITGQLLARLDAQREPHLLYGRWVAEEEGRLVGVAGYGQWADVLVPGRSLRLCPRASCLSAPRPQTALYDALMVARAADWREPRWSPSALTGFRVSTSPCAAAFIGTPATS